MELGGSVVVESGTSTGDVGGQVAITTVAAKLPGTYQYHRDGHRLGAPVAKSFLPLVMLEILWGLYQFRRATQKPVLGPASFL